MATKPQTPVPALLSLGLRPFFLSAALFAVIVIPLWMLILAGDIALSGPFAPVDWHIHEMLFGYAGAVIAGFLFTAIPNWTGRMPTRGAPLAALPALWALGRLAVGGAFGLGPVAVMLIDMAFPAAICAMIVREIVAGRNWRNLKVVVPVLVFALANAAFHLEAMSAGVSDMSRRLGFAVVLFLIMLIGGRIIPSFTRNWLAKRGPGPMPVQFSRFDALCLGAGVLAMGLWTARPEGGATGAALIAAACLHAARLARWRGWRGRSAPLLAMLHASYGFIPLGLAASGAAALGLAAPAAGLHLLGIGAVGGMTVAVMMRASLGHTGRALEAGPWLTAAYAAVALAAPARALLDGPGLWVAAALWTLGFAIFAAKLGPALAAPSVAARKPN
jgi:uncharacterized protein involved in response to NO